jgi:hypothetical protein
LEQFKDASPALGAVIAAITAIVAFGAFIQARKVNRGRATLDMVLKTFVEEEGQERYNKFKDVMLRHADPDNPLDIMVFADPASHPTDDRQILRSQLNEYELIALGIRRKLFDEKLYKLWFQDQFQRDYRSLEAFISTVREQRPSVFCECVWLYTRWSKAPHPENAPNRWKLMWWGFTKNDEKLKAFAAVAPECR